MSLLPTVSAVPRVIVTRAPDRVRAAGNANASRTLDGECNGNDQFAPRPHTMRRTAALSRIGTQTGAPLWNGPRLQPAFVAQVLGQVLMDPAQRGLSLAPAAYGREAPQIPNGSFFDGDI